jgi:hypothetical protein
MKYMTQVKKFMSKNKKAVTLSTVTTVALAVTSVSAFADTTDISGAMTTSLQSVVTNTLACIAAVAPIGITIFGAILAWKVGVKFFKGLAK